MAHVSEPFVEEVAQVDGQPIGYCRYGHGPTKILAICGAVGCYAKDWPEENLRLFDPDLVTIVAFDPPGYGKSQPPERKYEIRGCEKDAVFGLKLMEQLELTPFTVAGWSEGARTSIHVAVKGKEKVQRMILLACLTRVDARGAAIFRGLRDIDQWDFKDREDYLKHCSHDFLKRLWSFNCDLVNEAWTMLAGRFPCEEDALPRVTVPTLLLHGSQDKLAGHPKYILDMLKAAKSKKLEEHLHGSHDFHKKYPKWVVQKMEKFIKDTPVV